jgi:hypothetical protein
MSVAALAAAGLAVSTPASAEPSELADAGGISVRNGAGLSIASVRSDGVSGQAKGKPGGGTSNGITYRGGPVMTGPTTRVYYIWYGDWSTDSANKTPAKDILTDFATYVGGSRYYNINTTYYQGTASNPVQNSVTYVSATETSASTYGTRLSDGQIQSIVADAISSDRLPKDEAGVYFVLTAKGVTATSGFLTKYCGWHTHAPIGGADIKYSFVGNPGGSAACLVQTSTSPNENADADGMASIVAHELVEAVTDPDLNAWYDSRGYENADKCAWTFGTQSTAANGSKYNLTLNGRNYLIQQNWLNANGGKCTMSY